MSSLFGRQRVGIGIFHDLAIILSSREMAVPKNSSGLWTADNKLQNVAQNLNLAYYPASH